MTKFWSFKHPRDGRVEVLVGRTGSHHGVIVHKGARELVRVLPSIAEPGKIFFPYVKGGVVGADVALVLQKDAPPGLWIAGREKLVRGVERSSAYARSVQKRLSEALRQSHKSERGSVSTSILMAEHEIVARAFSIPRKLFGQTVAAFEKGRGRKHPGVVSSARRSRY
ncbi:MAG TPA: hypothetical protein VGQ00_04530 [Candidatus Norongarragalinales archaeon]|jgi:hypothetical protein|nr:hypothetical protein [Candidatus Norongarragalinales archaeon]